MTVVGMARVRLRSSPPPTTAAPPDSLAPPVATNRTGGPKLPPPAMRLTDAKPLRPASRTGRPR